MNSRTMHAMVGVLTVLIAANTNPAQAQTDDDVPLIMLRPQGAGALSRPRLEKLYNAIRKRSSSAKSQVLPLTNTEVWTVPQANVQSVRKAAARHGVVMRRLTDTWNRVFERAPATTRLGERERSLMERARASIAAIGVGIMVAPRPPMVEYALTKGAAKHDIGGDAAVITVSLSDQTILQLRRTSVEVRTDMCIWRGIVEGTGEPATLMWWPGGRMIGTVQHGGRIYSIRHLGGELHAVVEFAESSMPLEHAPVSRATRADDPRLRDDPLVQQGDASTARPGRVARAADAKPVGAAKDDQNVKDIVIDVLVVYTRKAASNYADVKHELIELAMEEANESFRQSGIGHIKVRLVHAHETNYDEGNGSHFDHVWAIADKGDGKMEEVHALREKHKADVVILIVDDAQGCGLATRVFADADEAFAVVHHECAAATYSVAHEIGHLIGARHDLSLDTMMTPFPYGHGYVNGTKWRDIMSYKQSCNGCPRVPVWSSPLVKVRGEPAGTPDLDNARVIREQAARVAAFR